MNKVVSIEGMMCNNCVKHVEEAFKAKAGEVRVVLEDKKAYLTNTSLTDEQIKTIVDEAGYTVTEIING